MAKKASKMTVAKIIALAKKNKISLTALATAITKAIGHKPQAALPAPARTSTAQSRKGKYLSAVHKAYAAFKAKNGKAPTKPQREKIMAGLRHLLVAKTATATKPRVSKTKPRVSKTKPVATKPGTRTASALKRQGQYVAAVKKAYASFAAKHNGTAPTAAQKETIKARLRKMLGKTTVAATTKPRVSKTKPRVSKTKPAVKPSGRTTSSKKRQGQYMKALHAAKASYKAATGKVLKTGSKDHVAMLAALRAEFLDKKAAPAVVKVRKSGRKPVARKTSKPVARKTASKRANIDRLAAGRAVMAGVRNFKAKHNRAPNAAEHNKIRKAHGLAAK